MTSHDVGGVSVSRETLHRLDEFEALVRHWTGRINLISTASVPRIRVRHTADSAQLLLLAPATFDHWLDLGSGGGFPGIVLAILAQDTNPNGRFTLIESDQRKAAFLRTAIRTLGLKAQVISDRIESIAPQDADVVSARALAGLPGLLDLAMRHLRSGGRMIFPKGRNGLAEIDQARVNWHFEATQVPSMTDPDATVLIIQGLSRA